MRLILEVKNPTEELTGICTFHFGRGIFRYAQYDVLLKLEVDGVAGKAYLFA